MVDWEQGELAGNILSLIESSDSDQVLNHGLKVFIAMQESSLLLGEELSSRLNEINGQQIQNEHQWSNETMMSFQRIFFLLQNTPLEKKLLDLNYMLDDTSCNKFEEYKHATRNAVSLLKKQPTSDYDDFQADEQDQLMQLKNQRIRELESASAAMGS